MKRYFKQVPANLIGVIPRFLKNFESHGISYDHNEYHKSEVFGAQCGACHTIVWLTGRNNDPILNEKKPENIPDSGLIYKEYYQDKLQRFLTSLPPCPSCHRQAYDLFVTNITLVRFEDGTPYPVTPEDWKGINEEMSEQVKDRLVWWYGDDNEAKRLDL